MGFFKFCKELLEKYKDNPQITSIAGYTPVNIKEGEISYTFSRYNFLWGWATWAKVWNEIYDKEKIYSKKQDPNSYLKKILSSPLERLLFKKRYLDSIKGEISTWEFPWVFGQIRKKGLCVVPRTNMITNIGIEEDFTNTKPNKVDLYFLQGKGKDISFPLKHPKKVKLDKSFNRYYISRDIFRIILKKIFVPK